MKTLWTSWCLSSGFSHEAHHLIPVCCQTLTPPTEAYPQFSHGAPCIYMSISPSLLSLLTFFFFVCFYLDRKTPEVFLVGNSWRGMLLRDQGVRVESRFSGSSLTPCSAIPSRALCHDRHRVRTRSGVRKLSPVLAQPDPGVLVARGTYALFHSDFPAPLLHHSVF